MIFGIGGGWNAEEMESHGTAFKSRWKVLRERMEAMKELWTKDEASYHGEFVKFDRLWCWPKPVQKPYPPILLGSHGPRGLQRVVRYCDGWLPNAGRASDLIPQIGELRKCAEQGGRDPKIFRSRPSPHPRNAKLSTSTRALESNARCSFCRLQTPTR